MHRVSKDMEAKNTAGLNKRVGLWRCQIRGLTTVVIMCYIQDPVIYLFVVLANVFYVLVQTVLNLSSWDPVSFYCTSNFLVQQTLSYNKNCRISIFEWSWNPRKIDVNIWMCYNWICTKTEYIWCLIKSNKHEHA